MKYDIINIYNIIKKLFILSLIFWERILNVKSFSIFYVKVFFIVYNLKFKICN